MPCLLDKSVVRFIVAALRFESSRPLSIMEQGALVFWYMAEQRGMLVFIPDLNHLPTLRRRLRAMTAQLQAPFHQATLPRLTTPDEMLSEWVG